MISLLAAILMTSPLQIFEKSCTGLEFRDWVDCQPRVISLGTWDPVYLDYKAETATMPDAPKPFGEYKTEK